MITLLHGVHEAHVMDGHRCRLATGQGSCVASRVGVEVVEVVMWGSASYLITSAPVPHLYCTCTRVHVHLYCTPVCMWCQAEVPV
mmetsp:Transcript_14715/g.32006  ORF Transcript_14715/g.32006 Transcript_14715/m.32006 type:complete len:85 (-) Transcript_14715:463-717(-)